MAQDPPGSRSSWHESRPDWGVAETGVGSGDLGPRGLSAVLKAVGLAVSVGGRLVVEGADFTVMPKGKVGLVGRTDSRRDAACSGSSAAVLSQLRAG